MRIQIVQLLSLLRNNESKERTLEINQFDSETHQSKMPSKIHAIILKIAVIPGRHGITKGET